MSSQVINLTETTTPAAGDWLYLQLAAGGAGSDRKIKFVGLTPVGKPLAVAAIWLGTAGGVAAAAAVAGIVRIDSTGVVTFHSSAFGTSVATV